MNFVKKIRFKLFWKKRWYIVLASTILPTVALAVGLVGFIMTGWNPIEWLHSRWAVSFFVCVIFGLMALAAFLYFWFRFKMLEG